MPTTMAWPSSLLPARVMFHPEIPSASGGPSFTGFEQPVISSAGRWKARLTFPIKVAVGASPRRRILAARQMVAFMKGRANAIQIGPFDENTPPFITGTGGSTTATLAASVAVDALTANVTSNKTISAGMYFGIGTDELYLIDSVIGSAPFILTFWPPMRAAHSSGVSVNFDTPTCLMRNATDDSGMLEFTRGSRAEQTLDLVEALS